MGSLYAATVAAGRLAANPASSSARVLLRKDEEEEAMMSRAIALGHSRLKEGKMSHSTSLNQVILPSAQSQSIDHLVMSICPQ